MRSAAYVVTILLLASTLAGFSSAASSTPAQVVTSYSYSEVPISTITWTSTVQQVLYSNSFPVPPPSPGTPRFNGCNIVYDTFTAPSGQVTGTVSTNYPVDFYLLSQGQFSTWSSANTVPCDGPSSYLVARTGISSENPSNLNVNLPTAGQYYIIFFNQSQSLTPNVVVNIMSVGTTETYTTTSDSSYIQTNLVTEGVKTNSATRGPNSSILMLGIVTIIVVALGAIIVEKRRKTETRSVSKTAVVASDTMFCRKCGAKIPRDSTFCKECGEKTTKA